MTCFLPSYHKEALYQFHLVSFVNPIPECPSTNLHKTSKGLNVLKVKLICPSSFKIKNYLRSFETHYCMRCFVTKYTICSHTWLYLHNKHQANLRIYIYNKRRDSILIVNTLKTNKPNYKRHKIGSRIKYTTENFFQKGQK